MTRAPSPSSRISCRKVISLPADPVTGLLTRSGVEKLVEWRLGSRSARTVSTVLYGDIDQLHVVNDLLGFEAGDQVIAAVAHALQAQLASRDAVLSRLSGDRFTIFFPDCPLDRARAIGDELRDAVSAMPLTIGTDSIPLSISFGAATVRGGERSFDHALAAAEVACKAAKDRGRNRVESYEVHDSSINRRIDDIAIVGRLRGALEKGNFQIFGQPIAPLLQPEKVRRYEMLLRLIDEKGRLVLPGQFMSSATRYQLLPQIDRCVISDVLTRLAAAKRAARVRADAPVDQPVGPDAQRPDVPRLAGRADRQQRRARRLADVRADRDRRGEQPRARTAPDGAARRDRLPLRARRLRHRPLLARAPEGAAVLGAEDRRLVHPRHPAQRALAIRWCAR